MSDKDSESPEYLRGRKETLQEFIKYGLVNYSSYDDVYWCTDSYGYEHDIKFPKRDKDAEK